MIIPNGVERFLPESRGGGAGRGGRASAQPEDEPNESLKAQDSLGLSSGGPCAIVPRMKQLSSPGRVQVTSTLARSRSTQSVAARVPCFKQLWRDCTNMDSYLVFHDNTVYHYDADSLDDVRQLTEAMWHGVLFNARFRRSLSVPGGYERFTGTIPSTAVLIYSYPPYPGTDPGDCPSPGCSHPNAIQDLPWNSNMGVPVHPVQPVPIFWPVGQSNSGDFTILRVQPSDIDYMVHVTLNYSLIVFQWSDPIAPGGDSNITLRVGGVIVGFDDFPQFDNSDTCQTKTGMFTHSFVQPAAGPFTDVQMTVDGVGWGPGMGYPFPPPPPFPCGSQSATMSVLPLCPV